MLIFRRNTPYACIGDSRKIANPLFNPVVSGNNALKVFNRSVWWSHTYQIFTDQLSAQGPGRYIIAANFQAVTDSMTGKVGVRILHNGGETLWKQVSDSINTSGWTLITDTLDLNWEGELEESYIFVSSVSKNTSFYVDDFSLVPDSLYVTSVSENRDVETPETYQLFQNYPNPFNPTTNIRFNIPKATNVTLKIYSVNGQEIATLVNRKLNAGQHNFEFNASKLSSGVYFYQIEAGSFFESKKMILLK